MKSEFLWHTATYFNVTVTTTYHPGYERPKRTGSQCSSISSSPHMRKARSSYLWTGFLIAANGKMFKKAWSSLLPPALQASYCSNIFQVQDAKSNLKKISCTLQAYSLHEKNKHQKLENNLNDHLVSCYIQGYSSLGNADLLAVGHRMALVPEVRYSLLCHPKQADAPSLCQWSPRSTNYTSARSVLKAWWERLCSQYSHLDKPTIVDDQRPKTLSPKFLWVWLTRPEATISPSHTRKAERYNYIDLHFHLWPCLAQATWSISHKGCYFRQQKVKRVLNSLQLYQSIKKEVQT